MLLFTSDLDQDAASEAGDSVESGVGASEVPAAAADDPDGPDPVQDVCADHPLVHSIASVYRRFSSMLTLCPSCPPPSTPMATLSPSFLTALSSFPGWPSPGPG